MNGLIREFPANESLGIKDGIGWISGRLVLGCVTNETLFISESDVRGSGVYALIVSDNLNFVVLPNTDARVGGAEIDSDARHWIWIICVG